MKVALSLKTVAKVEVEVDAAHVVILLSVVELLHRVVLLPLLHKILVFQADIAIKL